MRKKLVPLLSRLRRERPDLSPTSAGDKRLPHSKSSQLQLPPDTRVFVGGAPVTNVNALVDAHAALVVDVGKRELRGAKKLRAALALFDTLDLEGRTCLDLGASTGGFTSVLLERGAAKVYAVDVGYGQLLGSLRLDPRVVNLERTNLGALDHTLVPDVIDVVTADLSYVSLASAFAQLEGRVRFAAGALALVLVKPMFELALDHAPVDDASLASAIETASTGLINGGWTTVVSTESSERGARGAREGWVLARKVRNMPP